MNNGSQRGKPKINGKPTLRQILDYYDAWLRHEHAADVARAVGVSHSNLVQWPGRHPEMALAKKLADERRGNISTITNYVYKHLSKEARECWDKIQFWEGNESSYEKVEEILGDRSKRLRQELFIHALINASFDISEACSKVAITRGTLEGWRKFDFEFRQMIEQIHVAKRDFFEAQLVSLVEQQHPAAVIFVNRTVNADRGYGERLQLEHSLEPGTVDLESLDLDIDTRRKILEAIRKKKQLALQAPTEEEKEAIEV